MNKDQMETEAHSSERMAAMMDSAGDPRPASAQYCHCHAMVSGSHNEAAGVRDILAWCLMRSAVPHSRIHRKSYYRWLGDLINPMLIKNNDDLLRMLKMVRMRLQSGSQPKHILAEMGL